MSLIKNLRNRGLKDINLRKAKIYLRYWKYRLKGTSYPELLVPEYREQIAIRMANPGCRECVLAGECIHCGCPSPELFYDKDNRCSEGNFDTMYDPETWRETGVKPDPFYLKQIENKGVIKEFK